MEIIGFYIYKFYNSKTTLIKLSSLNEVKENLTNIVLEGYVAIGLSYLNDGGSDVIDKDVQVSYDGSNFKIPSDIKLSKLFEIPKFKNCMCELENLIHI